MNINSKNPNAHYDLIHGQPKPIEHDGDGSHLIRWAITPEMGVPETDDAQEVQIGWQCHELRIWQTPTPSVVKKSIIRYYLGECEEFQIINDYNKHALGVIENETAVAEYRQFLEFIESLNGIVAAMF